MLDKNKIKEIAKLVYKMCGYSDKEFDEVSNDWWDAFTFFMDNRGIISRNADLIESLFASDLINDNNSVVYLSEKLGYIDLINKVNDKLKNNGGYGYRPSNIFIDEFNLEIDEYKDRE